MALEEWWALLFSRATGWLGWAPEVALTTPVALILLAIEGKADWIRRTRQGFGQAEVPAPDRPDPDQVAQKLAAALRGLKRPR